MAEIEAAKGQIAQARTLAQRIVDAQGAETDQMSTVAKATLQLYAVH